MTSIDRIRQHLNSRKGTWPIVCAETGLNYSWLTKLAQGKIPNPGYEKVSVLVKYFEPLSKDISKNVKRKGNLS